jgi:hypothetical protein
MLPNDTQFASERRAASDRNVTISKGTFHSSGRDVLSSLEFVNTTDTLPASCINLLGIRCSPHRVLMVYLLRTCLTSDRSRQIFWGLRIEQAWWLVLKQAV